MAGRIGAVVCLVAAAGLSASGTARADTVAGAQARIATVRTEISAAAGRVHDSTVAYAQAEVAAGSADESLAGEQGVLATVAARLASSRSLLRATALRSYVGGTPTLPSGGSLDPGLSTGYAAVAVGNVADVVDQVRTRTGQLRVEQAVLAARQKARHDALAATGSARRTA